MAENQNFPDWDKTSPEESLKQIYLWLVGHIEGQISWYRGKIKPRRIASQSLRAISIILGFAGTLAPLLQALDLFDNIALGQWGYIAFALAAALLLFDRFFGLSSSWMRFIATQMALETILKELQFEWTQSILSNPAPGEAELEVRVVMLKNFSARVDDLIKDETDTWIGEFQRNLADLEKYVKTKKDTYQSGSVKVVISSSEKFEEGIEIKLNDRLIKTIRNTKEALLSNISPGQYEFSVEANKDDKQIKKTKVIEVKASEMLTVDFVL